MTTRQYLLCLLTVCLLGHAEGFVRMCYFGSWTNTRPVAAARFDIQHVDPAVCTHLVYAFAKMDGQALKIMPAAPGEADLLSTKGRYSRFNELKSRNPSLRTLLSVGGEAADKSAFEKVVKQANLEEFARSAATLVRSSGFDGLDVDWEFPTDPLSFTRLLEALRAEFEREAKSSGKTRLLLTAAVGAGDSFMKNNYQGQVPSFSRSLDYILVMAYDFAGSWLDKTYFNAPLHSRNDSRFSPANSQEYVMEKVWLAAGAPPEKLVLGMTGAGAAFTLADSSNHGVGAPFINMSAPGHLYQLPGGRLAYPEICYHLRRGGERVWDEEQAVPYAYWGDTWVGYDDAQSVAAKTAWAKKRGLGGVMFWMIDFDDWSDSCEGGAYPLLKAARKASGADVPPTLTPVRPGVVVLNPFNAAAILSRPTRLALLLLVAMVTAIKTLLYL